MGGADPVPGLREPVHHGGSLALVAQIADAQSREVEIELDVAGASQPAVAVGAGAAHQVGGLHLGEGERRALRGLGRRRPGGARRPGLPGIGRDGPIRAVRERWRGPVPAVLARAGPPQQLDEAGQIGTGQQHAQAGLSQAAVVELADAAGGAQGVAPGREEAGGRVDLLGAQGSAPGLGDGPGQLVGRGPGGPAPGVDERDESPRDALDETARQRGLDQLDDVVGAQVQAVVGGEDLQVEDDLGRLGARMAQAGEAELAGVGDVRPPGSAEAQAAGEHDRVDGRRRVAGTGDDAPLQGGGVGGRVVRRIGEFGLDAPGEFGQRVARVQAGDEPQTGEVAEHLLDAGQGGIAVEAGDVDRHRVQAAEPGQLGRVRGQGHGRGRDP